MEFKDNHFDDYRKAQHTVLQKGFCKKYEGFWPEKPPKISNDADQTDLEKQKQNKKSRKTNQNRLLRIK